MKLLQKDNNSIFLTFIFFAVALLPFNALPYFSFLGEMSGEGAFYPLLIGVFIWIAFFSHGKKIIIPNHIVFTLLMFFFVWVLVSGIANFNSITTSFIKGRTGIEKYLFQTIVLGFCIGVTLFLYNFLFHVENYLELIRLFILVSFTIAAMYSLVEIMYLLGSGFGQNILELINPYIREPGLYSRLRSVSGEASWFAMYCSFILPWLVSYVFTKKNKSMYFLVVIYLLVMIALSFSRTAYFITMIQLGTLFFILLFTRKDIFEKRKLRSLFFAVLLGLIIMVNIAGLNKFSVVNVKDVVTSFINSDSTYTQSNIARFGSQTTAINMGINHPAFGVGLGQYGFYMPDYVPEWARGNGEIERWMSEEAGTPWPPVHGIYHRIFAELGFIGLALWLLLWTLLLFKCFNKYMSNTKKLCKPDYLGLALFLSIIGVLLSGLNMDTFRFMGYWITMALGIIYIQR